MVIQFIKAFTKPFGLSILHGKNIVTADLVAAMKEVKILRGRLDVLEYEKLSFETLFQEDNTKLSICTRCSNVILTPHVAWLDI
jgi:D-3-phosphoglycerate dehydrogenase